MNIKRSLSFFLSVTLLTFSTVIPVSAEEPEEEAGFCGCFESQEFAEEFMGALIKKQSEMVQSKFMATPYQVRPGNETSECMPSTGEVKMLVLPIAYSDHEETKEKYYDAETYETELFFNEYNPDLDIYDQSVRGYYQWASNGRLDITGTVLPIYTAPHPGSYYEKNSLQLNTMIGDALEYYVDQGLKLSEFDNDGNGVVDAFVVHSLSSGDSTLSAWKNIIRTLRNRQIGDCTVAAFAHTTRAEGTNQYVRKTTCHEIGHLLGMSDHYSGSTCTLDYPLYDLMASGEYINAYYKLLFGWIDPIILTNENTVGEIELTPVEKYMGENNEKKTAVVLIPESSNLPFTEFYIAEYRTGKFGNPIYPSIFDESPGIVIWHCDTYYNPADKGKQYYSAGSFIKPVYKSGTENYGEKDIYIKGDEFSSDSAVNSSFYNGEYTGAYLKVEELTPEKAILRAGFRGPNLRPGPTISISKPSVPAIRSTETATFTITVISGSEVIPRDDYAREWPRYPIFSTGTLTGTGTILHYNENPMLVEYTPSYVADNGEGKLWFDIPPGAVQYNAKDSPPVKSEVIYVDNTPPEITLRGENPQRIQQGMAYTELGAVATDNLDPNIAKKLQIDATKVNTNVPDTYKVIYSVTDHVRYTTTVERTVIVEEGLPPHEHHFSASWKNNETSHWHECECGEKADLTAHTPEPIPGQEATCTQPGKTDGSRCSVCGRILVEQRDIPKTNHEISETWHYGTIYEDDLGHWHECVNCQTMFDLGLHVEDGGIVTKEPTQEETGIKIYLCSVCGYVMRTEVLDKLDPSHTHSYPEQWSHDAVNHWKECTTCHEKAEQAPHTWDSGTVTTAPSSSKAGVRTYTCTVCKRTRTETIPATGGGGSGGGGGGGGSSTPIPTEYKVTLPDKTAGGSVKASPVKAVKGTKVTLSVEAEEGYELEELGARDKKGKTITLEEKEGQYTFSMPASDVEVTVLFREMPKEEPKEGPTPPPKKEPDPVILPFTDVPEKAWYYDAVKEVYSRGIMTGLSETQFGPELPASRGMVVTMLYRMEEQPAVRGGAGFTDVPEKQYYAPAVAWATELGLVNGYGDNTFRPNEGITREQLVTILYRYAGQRGRDVTQRADLSGFFDASRISPYARESMAWAKAAGLLNGADWGGIDPGGAASRGQIAAILGRFLEL